MEAGSHAGARNGGGLSGTARTQDLITETLQLEETRFRKTLERGLRILDEELRGLKSGDSVYRRHGFQAL